MGQDEDWVANVKRWVHEAPAAVETRDADAVAADESDIDGWGYEAAYPSLQARHWVEPSDR